MGWFQGAERLSVQASGVIRKILVFCFLLFVGCLNLAHSERKLADGDGFSMCDDFIEVEWISPARSIGLAKYDLIDSGGGRRSVAAIVYLDKNYPRVNYGGLKEGVNPLEGHEMKTRNVSILREERGGLNIERDQALAIETWKFRPFKRNDGAMEFERGESAFLIYQNYWQANESLTGFSKVVCVLYPGLQQALIVELPIAANVYADRELARIYRNISASASDGSEKIWESDFRRAGVLDVNGDGVDDYPGLGIYSSEGGYLRVATLLSAAGIDKGCKDLIEDSFFITTDGDDYFLNGTCGLKGLTRRSM